LARNDTDTLPKHNVGLHEPQRVMKADVTFSPRIRQQCRCNAGVGALSRVEPGTALVQNKRRERPESLNQLWASNYGYVMPYDPKVAVSAEGDNLTRGAAVVVDSPVGFPNNIRQQWAFDSP